MTNNKEIKIAIAVGVIMLTICFVIVVSGASTKKAIQNASEIKVYKHYNDGEKQEYHECNITTNDLVNINNEYNSILQLDEEDKYPGASINGTYRITKGTSFIAFDGTDNLVYRGDTEAIYIYQTDLYEYVANLCK